MELNDYNGFEDHCKAANEMELLKRKYIHKEPHNNMDSIDHMMQRKDQEFMDHAALLPPDHFIMDLINFPKGVVSNGSHNGADTLPPDLHFHNTQLFPVTTEDQHHHHHHHSNEQRKSPTYLPLNNDFLMPVSKPYNPGDNVGTVEVGSDKVVQELLLNGTGVTMDDGSIVDDDCDISRFDSRKVLPHKKRISRKLKINHTDVDDLQLNVPLEEHKLPQLVVGAGVQQFRCELCQNFVTCSQLEFFAHLKQHYEPSTPDNILAAMKTSLDALGPEKSEAASNLCTIDKKTDGLDQVFQDVHFPFDNFTQTDTVVDTTDRRVVVGMDMQTHVERVVDMKVVYNNTYENPTNNLHQQQPQQHHHQQQVQVQVQQPQTHQPSQNLVPEEFSDTEDMLEGIRDKVLIEDTCDAMDLMTPTSNGVRPHWFNNNCFTGIDSKGKPFCDVLFSGQFAPMLNAEPTTLPQDNHSMGMGGKLMPKDLIDTSPQMLSHPTDLRLQFPQTNDGMNHSHETPAVSQPSIVTAPQPQPQQIQTQQPHIPQTHSQPILSNNLDHIQPQQQHIKMENNSELPAYQTENALVVHNQVDDEVYDDCHSDDYRSLSPNSNHENVHVAKEDEEADETEDGDYEAELGDEDVEDGENNEDGTGKRKRYVCNKCQRVFNSCNALKYHHRTHLGLRPHHCDICGKSFFAVGALKAHIRTHTGDKPFQCPHCDRKFRQWGDLKYHTVSIHSNMKNHQCEYCGKSFSRKYSLVVHVRIHTSERNYKCEFCTKSFRASTYLQNHRKIHTGEKPFECEVCGKKFRVSGDLRRHQRVHERNQLKQKGNVLATEKQNTPALNKTSASPPTT
ncbi:uncharacterized protein [Musca autumnalis]|uniref:uncharacterized protein n=1 Tax=Musca autumnalis TaxID=221902 RepID=UPI003CE9084E